MERIPLAVDKIEAVRLVMRQVGCLDAVLAALGRLPGRANPQFVFGDSDGLPGVVTRTYFPASEREALPPDHRNGRPTEFPERTGTECSPAFEVLEIADGTLAQVGRAPVVLLPSGECVVADYSSGYSRLLHAYALDMPRLLAEARRVRGTALVLCDDVWPFNYAHWLLDELPRLAFLGGRRDLSVLVSAPVARVQHDTLLRCGFAAEQIVAVEDFSAVQADRLLVSRDVHEMPHPAFKGAPWALEFLRSRLGPASTETQPRSKIYVSRADSRGRHLVNEDALMQRLQPLGYERVTLALRSVPEQAALFASAGNIVGLHGAGLANLAFARPGTQVVELFPTDYGTPAFYVVATAAGCRYASYVSDGEVLRQPRAQIHDARLDLDRFMTTCGDLL